MQLSVLQWNVWYKQDVEAVVQFLRGQDADVICLQELTRGYIGQTQENTWEYIAHALGYAYRVQEIPIITAEAQWSQANAIFSRYPITGRTSVWLHEPEQPDAADDQYRGYLEVTIDADGTPVTIATTHMSFKQQAADTSVPAAGGIADASDDELAQLLARLEQNPKRYILTGDLNATPGHPRVNSILQHLDNAGPDLQENTWTTKPYTFADHSATTLDWRYDYIFVSRDMHAVKAAILPTDVSDHLPVLATIEIS